MSKNKSNIDHLRELVKDNDEANEFIDAIEQEFDELKTEISDAEAATSEAEREKNNAESKLEELEEQMEYHETIQTGMEKINYHVDNIALQGVMEVFGEKLNKIGHIRMEQILSAL